MDGFARSIGNGISGFFGNAIGAIGGALKGAVDSVAASVHGGGGIVIGGAVALIVLAGILVLRR
ncbi:MAG TPA: hypothetical protein VK656_04355 [Candidatus Acidoferrum sp.]|nr:hypothetical protein [Candidatus Acidoferrum sp.]